MNILKVKEWLDNKKKAQFQFITTCLVRRLSDDFLFITGAPTQIDGVIYTIEGFNEDMIHVFLRAKQKSNKSIYLKEINSLYKIMSPGRLEGPIEELFNDERVVFPRT